METELKFAVLIDADNISDKYIKIILEETAQQRHRHLQEDLRGLDQSSAGLLEICAAGQFYYSHAAVQLHHGEKRHRLRHDY